MSSDHDREHAGSAGEDSAVVRAWRQASDEHPPARLDASILASARRSVEAEAPDTSSLPVRPRTRGRWMRWQPLAAAATVAGLAFVLVQTIPREREVAPPVRIEVPAPAPSPEAEVAPPVRGDTPAVAPAPGITLESRSSAPAPAVTEAPAALDAGQRLRERGPAGTARAPAAEAPGEAFSAEAAAPATEQTAARAASAAAPPSAADWSSRIEALHASGDLAGAAEALRGFRTTDPAADSHLPESLREWARTVE